MAKIMQHPTWGPHQRLLSSKDQTGCIEKKREGKRIAWSTEYYRVSSLNSYVLSVDGKVVRVFSVILDIAFFACTQGESFNTFRYDAIPCAR